MPNGKGTKAAGASNGKGPKGEVLSPHHPSLEGVAPVSQGKSYKQPQLFPQATPEPAFPQGKYPKPEPTPGPAAFTSQGKSLKAFSHGPTPDVVPQGKYPKPEPLQLFCRHET